MFSDRNLLSFIEESGCHTWLGSFANVLAPAHRQTVRIPTISGKDSVFNVVLTWSWFPIANSPVLVNILIRLLLTLRLVVLSLCDGCVAAVTAVLFLTGSFL